MGSEEKLSTALGTKRVMKKKRLTNVLRGGAVIPLALALVAIATPYLLTHGFPFIALALQRAFAVVCHQRPERSLELFGGHAAVAFAVGESTLERRSAPQLFYSAGWRSRFCCSRRHSTWPTSSARAQIFTVTG